MQTPLTPVRQLFERALVLPEDRRAEFLTQACDGDAALHAAVESLLRADALDGSFLDGDLRLHGTPAGLVGQELGAYRIERLIAAGGMGVVFEATQREPRRTVALKVLHGPFLHPERIARFRLEAQVLARLEHPGIARIHEAGSASVGGHPVLFLALELVHEALPITEYAQRHGLARRERLRLFRDVCVAVAYGHGQAVVHRDLKPANLLVDPRGQVKVIDFGIARALDADPALSQALTVTGELVGTPRYMSPEQLQGQRDAVDARTDVWSLGVVLFELLTGAFPFELDGLSPTGVARLLAERDPARLSRHGADLRGDLEIIVERALARSPADRYGSVEQLGREIDRFLAGEPIEARADHALYVLRKRARRHRRLLGGVSVILVLVASSAVLMGLSWQREVDAHELSERTLYRNQIVVAASALEAGRIAELRRTLERCDPSRRSWEWGHLMARSDDSVWTASHGSATVPVYAVALSPDASRLASSDSNGVIRSWDPASGRPTGRLEGHTHLIKGLAFDPLDGSRLFSASYDRTLREWDVVTQSELRCIRLLHAPWTLALSPEGERIALGGDAGSVEVRRRHGGETIWSARAFEWPVTCLSISSDGRWLACGGMDEGLLVWDLDTGSLVRRIERSAARRSEAPRAAIAHVANMTGLAFSPDAGLLYGSSEDGVVKTWNVETGELEGVLHYPGRLGTLALSSDGESLAIPSEGLVRLVRTRDAEPLEPLRGHEGLVSSAVFAPGGERLFSVALDGSAKAFDLARRAGSYAFGRHRSESLFGLARSGDGRRLASSDETGEVSLWDARSLACLGSFQAHDARVRRLSLDEAGARLVTSADDGKLRLFDVSTRNLVAEAEAPGRGSHLWTRHGLVVGGESDRLVLRDTEHLTEIAAAVTPGQRHGPMDASPDGRYVADSNSSGRVHLWAGADLAPVADWEAHEGGVWYVRFLAPDLLVTSGEDQRLRMWRVPDGALLKEAPLDGVAIGIVPLPDPRRILVLMGRGDPMVVSLETGETLLTLRGHASDPIRRGLVSLDDGRFVSADSSGVLRVWADTREVRR